MGAVRHDARTCWFLFKLTSPTAWWYGWGGAHRPHMRCGYVLTMDQSDTGSVGIFPGAHLELEHGGGDDRPHVLQLLVARGGHEEHYVVVRT
eukprot:9459789-Pyramimonas_sp.AAC.5